MEAFVTGSLRVDNSVPSFRLVVWLVCLFDDDGGDDDFVWRTAIFSTKEKAEAWAKKEECVYQLHEMVVDEPSYGGWEAVN